jgi:hypothetical protein
LPEEYSREDKKAIARFIANHFAAVDGYQFISQGQYTLNKRAKGRITLLNNAKAFRFNCSLNRSHKRNVSEHEHECKGSIIVLFPAGEAPFDIVVENRHPATHPGREIGCIPSKTMSDFPNKRVFHSSDKSTPDTPGNPTFTEVMGPMSQPTTQMTGLISTNVNSKAFAGSLAQVQQKLDIFEKMTDHHREK